MSAYFINSSLAIERPELLDVAADAARNVLNHTLHMPVNAAGMAAAKARDARPATPQDVLGNLDNLQDLARGNPPPAHATDAEPWPARTQASDGRSIMPLARLTLALRSSPGAERRVAPRFPYFMPCGICFDGQFHETATLDVGRKGTLVRRPEGCGVQPGARGTVRFSSIGTIDVRVTATNESSINLVITRKLSPVAEAAMNGLILRLRSENDYQAGQARMLATTVASAFAAGVARQAITVEGLLDRHYLPMTGTLPPQFTTQATPFYDSVLPAILARFFDPKSGMIYAVITDRNGYVPVHNEPYHQQQRPGDVAFNQARARQRRIYDDAVTLRAARFARDVVIQTYARDIDTGMGLVVKDIAAPIFVRGQRWGCAEIAYSLKAE